MKQKAFTVLDATAIVKALSRAGQQAGKTNVAKLAGVTIPRASRVLDEALLCGLVYTFANVYRSNVRRSCYAITETGRMVLEAVESHDDSLLWSISDER